MAVQAHALEQITMRKVYWRVLPLAILAYFLAISTASMSALPR